MKSQRSYSDHEIARYVLGLDMAEQTQDIQARLAHDDAAAACALKWETYFLGIVDALPACAPPDTVLTRIQASLGMEAGPILGDVRPQTDGPEPAQRRRGTARPERRTGRPLRLNRKRLTAVLGGVAMLCVLVVLVWASLRPAPTGTMVQETVQLGAR